MTYLGRINGDLDSLAALARQADESMASYLRELCESALVDLRTRLEGSQHNEYALNTLKVLGRSLVDNDTAARSRRFRFMNETQKEFASDLERFVSRLREDIHGMPPLLLYFFYSHLQGIREVPLEGIPRTTSIWMLKASKADESPSTDGQH